LRWYRKFSRTPVAVRAPKGDEQKMRMEQYVEENKSKFDPSVLQEMQSLKKIIKNPSIQTNDINFDKLQKPAFKEEKNSKNSYSYFKYI